MKKLPIIVFMLLALSSLGADEVINIEEAQRGMYSAVTQGFVFTPEVYDNCVAGFIPSQLLNPDEVPNAVKQIELVPTGSTPQEQRASKTYVNDPSKLWFYYKIMSRRLYTITVTVSELKSQSPDEGKFEVDLAFYGEKDSTPFATCTSQGTGTTATVLNETERFDLRRSRSFKVGITARFEPNGTSGAQTPVAPLYSGTAVIKVESK